MESCLLPFLHLSVVSFDGSSSSIRHSSVSHCLLLVCCCLLFVVCCLLFVVCCLLQFGCVSHGYFPELYSCACNIPYLNSFLFFAFSLLFLSYLLARSFCLMPLHHEASILVFHPSSCPDCVCVFCFHVSVSLCSLPLLV